MRMITRLQRNHTIPAGHLKTWMQRNRLSSAKCCNMPSRLSHLKGHHRSKFYNRISLLTTYSMILWTKYKLKITLACVNRRDLTAFSQSNLLYALFPMSLESLLPLCKKTQMASLLILKSTQRKTRRGRQSFLKHRVRPLSSDLQVRHRASRTSGGLVERTRSRNGMTSSASITEVALLLLQLTRGLQMPISESSLVTARLQRLLIGCPMMFQALERGIGNRLRIHQTTEAQPQTWRGKVARRLASTSMQGSWQPTCKTPIEIEKEIYSHRHSNTGTRMSDL